MKRLNILHLYSDENWTGPAESVLSLLKELDRRGHKAFFAGITKKRGRFLLRVREAGIPVIENLNLDRKSHPPNYLKNLATLPRVLKKEKINIIHTHFRYDHILASFVKKRVSLVHTLHRADLDKVNFQERFILRHKTGYIITISKAIKEKVIRNLGIERERISTI
ncbi:glycosyltransferase, partial [bacterium]|nr:glycosyltransferase [bacterium]